MGESERPNIRERSEEPSFIYMAENEHDGELVELFKIRAIHYANEKDSEREMKEHAEARKVLDKQLLAICDDQEKDGVIWGRTLLDRVYNKGRESWDANFLRTILTPEQLQRAKLPGKPYVYLQEKKAPS